MKGYARINLLVWMVLLLQQVLTATSVESPSNNYPLKLRVALILFSVYLVTFSF